MEGRKLFCIAGPCAAESREQVLACARALKPMGVTAFRAGAWKPRTRPGSFEGIGGEALEWLSEVREAMGMPVAVEVATPSHVEQASRYGIDIFWIGARTSSDPFAMQELAEALRGSDRTVLVKNPISQDVNLWIGAVERILGAGITRCGAMLRGFTSSHPGKLRNDPGWHVAIDFRQRMPAVPLLCDPSHIAGRRDKIQEVAQLALNLAFDGLFVEVHTEPDKALSDARQQLTPEAFAHAIEGLETRARSRAAGEDLRLDALRAQIDDLDYEILSAVAKRMETVREIGRLKRSSNMSVLQPERWNAVLEGMKSQGSGMGLAPEFVEALARLLHSQAIDMQLKE